MAVTKAELAHTVFSLVRLTCHYVVVVVVDLVLQTCAAHAS